jgi:hypothetical protein
MPRGTPQILAVEAARARFEEWRRNREGRAAIPDSVWTAATEIARRDGVGRTAATLHLDGTKLKRRMMQFVEMVAPVGSLGLGYRGARSNWKAVRQTADPLQRVPSASVVDFTRFISLHGCGVVPKI